MPITRCIVDTSSRGGACINARPPIGPLLACGDLALRPIGSGVPTARPGGKLLASASTIRLLSLRCAWMSSLGCDWLMEVLPQSLYKGESGERPNLLAPCRLPREGEYDSCVDLTIEEKY